MNLKDQRDDLFNDLHRAYIFFCCGTYSDEAYEDQRVHMEKVIDHYLDLRDRCICDGDDRVENTKFLDCPVHNQERS